jgi:putative intracellular protease/amidase
VLAVEVFRYRTRERPFQWRFRLTSSFVSLGYCSGRKRGKFVIAEWVDLLDLLCSDAAISGEIRRGEARLRIGLLVMVAAVAIALLISCSRGAVSAPSAAERAGPGVEEQKRTISALRPPKRDRPLIAILGDNAGTETTDFLVPFGVLTESNVADVIAVAPEMGPIQLMPALAVQPQRTTASFDALYPEGADYVIVPAMHRTDTPGVLNWIRAQSATGAIIVGICSGALVVAEAGLLVDRSATTHWFDIDSLERNNPSLTRVDDRRYVVDRGIATTTGVSASVPMSLALVEAIAGTSTALRLARRLGADEDWSARHESAAFQLSWRTAGLAAANWVSFWRHERIGMRVGPGVDEIALAFIADAYSRTYRSKAVTVTAAAGPVISKRGLVLLPDYSGDAVKVDQFVTVAADARPVEALENALDGIRKRYGDGVAYFVALQLEYPGWGR